MGLDLPKLVTEWPIFSCKNIIQPTWNASSFLWPPTNAASASTFISANHFYARKLKPPCPTSLLKEINKDFFDRSTWRDSHYE